MKEKNLKDIQTSEPLENLSNEDLSKALHNIVNELKKLNARNSNNNIPEFPMATLIAFNPQLF